MKKELRFALLILLLPVMIGAFYLDSRLNVSSFDHNVIQVMIVGGIYLMVWQWIRFDEYARNQQEFEMKHGLTSYRRLHLVKGILYTEGEQSVPAIERAEPSPIQQIEAPHPSIVWLEEPTSNLRLVKTAQENKN